MSIFRRAVRSFCQLLAILSLPNRGVSAQSPGAPPSTIHPVLFVRARMESWDWFDTGSAGRYEYVGVTVRAGLTRQSPHFAWRAELALPMLIGLPDDATLPPPAGQLGGGATTFEASGQRRDLIHVMPRQLWVRWGRPRAGPALKAGRFDFNDGAERTPKHHVLAALRTQRINQRLIGTFAFTHVQRSFDGVVASLDGAEGNLTLAAMRPTAGVFAARTARSLEVNLLCGAWSRDIRVGAGAADLRLFGIFSDDRRGVVPVDNRPLAARQADTRSLRVVTLGGHWLQAVPTGLGGVDLLAWGVLQRGSWGSLGQRSGAVALEVGFEPRGVPGRPWVRVGMAHSTGDDDPADNRHETFYQVLPTPRVYARHPFYNMMNSSELFASMQIRPHPKVTARVWAHRLRLTESTDLWYLGGGAFEPTTFGFAGRPANNAQGLATVVEGALEYRPDWHWAFEVFGNFVRGGPVVNRIYGGSGTARLLYLESSFTW